MMETMERPYRVLYPPKKHHLKVTSGGNSERTFLPPQASLTGAEVLQRTHSWVEHIAQLQQQQQQQQQREEWRRAVTAAVAAQRSGQRTLSAGEKVALVAAMDPLLHPPPFPIQPHPVLAAPDRGRSDLLETRLEGERIACFLVGGEKRLCLPQILNSVLRDFSLAEINAACDDLFIYCSRCHTDQLATLKACSILPAMAPSCGLITKTDAERLCATLLATRDDVAGRDDPRRPLPGIRVYHECLGKARGVFIPELHTSEVAACVQCAECLALLPPARFVAHAHRNREPRTCHWGFESSRWRDYIVLADGCNSDAERRVWDEVKSRFDATRTTWDDLRARLETANHLKRKQDNSPSIVKRSRPHEVQQHDMSQAVAAAATLSLLDPGWALTWGSAFRPFSPKDSPACTSAVSVGQQRVVSNEVSPPPPLQPTARTSSRPPPPHTGGSGQSYQPNVALKAPSPNHTHPHHPQPLSSDSSSSSRQQQQVVSRRLEVENKERNNVESKEPAAVRQHPDLELSTTSEDEEEGEGRKVSVKREEGDVVIEESGVVREESVVVREESEVKKFASRWIVRLGEEEGEELVRGIEALRVDVEEKWREERDMRVKLEEMSANLAREVTFLRSAYERTVGELKKELEKAKREVEYYREEHWTQTEERYVRREESGNKLEKRDEVEEERDEIEENMGIKAELTSPVTGRVDESALVS